MFLTNTASPLVSYLQLADLKADTTLDLTDRNGAALADATLNQLLRQQSAHLDTLIGYSLLPQEQTIQRKGDGTFYLRTNRYPLIYVRQIKVVLPSSTGYDIPVKSMKIDYDTGI